MDGNTQSDLGPNASINNQEDASQTWVYTSVA